MNVKSQTKIYTSHTYILYIYKYILVHDVNVRAQIFYSVLLLMSLNLKVLEYLM